MLQRSSTRTKCTCCRPLVGLIKGHVSSVQIKASLAVEVLADHNDSSQAAFLAQDAEKALIRLLKVYSLITCFQLYPIYCVLFAAFDWNACRFAVMVQTIYTRKRGKD